MTQTSDWKIVATQGATVDGRTITEAWIKDMAETYSHERSTALVWPEHYKGSTPWGPYEGKNWGLVEAVKAEKQSGKWRLFARITPNHYLLSANKDGQKLFTSIEVDPDYCGTGRCYLRGLGVTDKPASTGCTRLTFSDQAGQEVAREASELEVMDFSECQPEDTPLSQFFSALANLALHGELPNRDQSHPASPNEDDEAMNQEQFNQMMTKLDGIEIKQTELETQQKRFSETLTSTMEENSNESETNEQQPGGENTSGVTAEQFSQLMSKVDNITNQQDALDKQFKALAQAAPDQDLGQGGSDESTMEAV